MRARFGPDVCDHHVFGICGDGDLMEGISHEAASLAGHLQLGRMVFVYDDNHITIDGDTALAYSDDVPKRFEAYGWHVVQLGEAAEDPDALEAGLRAGMAEDRSPVAGRAALAHRLPVAQGAGHRRRARQPARRRRGRAVKEILGLPPARLLRSRRRARALPRSRAPRRRGARRVEHAADRVARGEPGARRRVRSVPRRPAARRLGAEAAARSRPARQIATRDASKDVLSAVVDLVPGLIVGSADLTGNTGMAVKGAGVVGAERRDAAAASTTAFASTAWAPPPTGWRCRGLLPTVGTFFVFSDYMRPRGAPRRRSCRRRSRSCGRHDSVGVGEDGPTHEPIEQLASLRAMPGLRVIRPADANEVARRVARAHRRRRARPR